MLLYCKDKDATICQTNETGLVESWFILIACLLEKKNRLFLSAPTTFQKSAGNAPLEIGNTAYFCQYLSDRKLS